MCPFDRELVSRDGGAQADPNDPAVVRSQLVGLSEWPGGMPMHITRSEVGLAIAATAVALVCMPAWGAGDEKEAAETRGQSAVWTARELSFVYVGFTAQYSCEGLRDRVTDVLLKLGARRDLEVRESPCMSLGRPDAFPGVRIRMNVLQPVTGQSTAAGPIATPTPAAVPAHWKRIDLASARNGVTAAECELLEQVKTDILPLFATRNVEYGSHCQPHQVQLGAAWLRAEVLVPDDQKAAADLSTESPGRAPGP